MKNLQAARHTVAGAIILTALTITQPARAQDPEYTLVQRKALPGHHSPGVSAINNDGVGVGSDSDSKGNAYPVVWQGAEPKLLGGLGDLGGAAFSMNRFGEIVGFATKKDGVRHAVQWASASAAADDLGTLGGKGVTSEAFGVSDQGEVIGYSDVSGQEVDCPAATRWSGRQAVPLPQVGEFCSFAGAINASGVIVGSLYVTSFPDSSAVRWESGIATQLNGILGLGSASSVNNAGEVVGVSAINNLGPNGVTLSHATFWKANSVDPVDLGSLLGDNGSSYASAINNVGQIIGGSDSADGLGHAVLWQAGKLLDLDHIVKSSLPKNIVLTFANAIADNGAIDVSAINTSNKQTSDWLLIPHYPSTTTLASSKDPSTEGQTVTFTAAVHPSGGSTATGTVEFRDGTRELGAVTLNSSEKAVFSTSKLSRGTHSITASFEGSEVDKGSASAVLKQVVR